MRYLSTLLILVVCTIGCQGPISDWPHAGGGDDGAPTGVGPVQSPAQPGATAGGGQTPPLTGSGTAGGTVAGTTTGTTAGTGAGGIIGGGTGSTTADAGLSGAGGTTGGTPAAGSDAGAAPADSGASTGDAGAGFPLDGGVDAQQPDAASDAGCAPSPTAADAGLCPAYGCRTQQQLRSAMNMQGACTSDHALAVACEGRVSNAALQCTQESVFSISLSRAVNTCLKRDPQLATLTSDCLNCFVEESLCTLSRCFAACTVSYGSECQACRQKECSAKLALCTGLPAP